jgi:xanthine/uracil permease
LSARNATAPVPASTTLARDLATAGLWLVVIVPQSFGFWFVAGDLAGVPPSDRQTLVLASLLAVGVATLVQVVAGYRVPVFEGPGNAYFAAVTVLSVGHLAGDPAAVTGGMLVAGVFVLLLGTLGIDRLFRRIFTPAVVMAFLIAVVMTVVPATVDRAIGRSAAHPWGVYEAWVSAAVVVVVTVIGQLRPRLRSCSLLAGLGLGTIVYVILAGLPAAPTDAGFAVPQLFPWGSPELSGSIVAPFAIAGVLAAFNIIASVDLMSSTIGEDPPAPATLRRALIADGGVQAIAACFGNLLGNVPRSDSVAVVRMIDSPRARALGLAAAAIIVLAFVGPVVAQLARLPIAVTAALVMVVLGLMLGTCLAAVAKFDHRTKWLVVAPAVAPTFAWLVVSSHLSETAQLLTNPMLIGVVLAVALDRLVPQKRARETAEAR